MDSSFPVQGTKIQKLSEGSDISEIEDRISNLPDALLCRILSFLQTRSAVQTSALAKRWKYLWVSVTSLDFELHLNKNYRGNREDFDSFREGYMNNFTYFLDRLLVMRDNLRIQKFRLSCYERIDFSRFYSWVCAVITCDVHELDLELTNCEVGELPWSLFTCKTLVVLKIHGKFVFNLPYYVCLPNLKTLSLNSLTYFDDALIQKFLSGCPAIEDLEIRRSRWGKMWTLNVSVPSLKRLTLELSINEEGLYHEADFKSNVMVTAPILEYLGFYDSMSDSLLVNDLPSLVEARLGIDKSFEYGERRKEVEYGNRTFGLLRSVSNVRSLSLGGYGLGSSGYCDPNLPTFRNLVHLELSFDSFNCPLSLVDLLESSPKLEVLVFPEGLTAPLERECNIGRVPFFHYLWSPPELVPECLLLSLKKIEIRKFFNEKKALNLVKYLLENAMVLEKMTVFCHYFPFEDNSFSFRDELENYPKGSTNCEFELYIP